MLSMPLVLPSRASMERYSIDRSPPDQKLPSNASASVRARRISERLRRITAQDAIEAPSSSASTSCTTKLASSTSLMTERSDDHFRLTPRSSCPWPRANLSGRRRGRRVVQSRQAARVRARISSSPPTLPRYTSCEKAKLGAALGEDGCRSRSAHRRGARAADNRCSPTRSRTSRRAPRPCWFWWIPMLRNSSVRARSMNLR